MRYISICFCSSVQWNTIQFGSFHLLHPSLSLLVLKLIAVLKCGITTFIFGTPVSILICHIYGRRQKKVPPPFDPYNGRPFKKNGRRTEIERAMNGTARSVLIPVSF